MINYRTLVREDFFRVDHTRYLRELEKYQTPVFLRPKRFGKSLWVSMLEYYYDVRFKDQFPELFGKTEIGRNPTPYANSFLVLSLDFSTITLGTVAEIERSFTTKLRGDADSFCISHKTLCDWPNLAESKTAADIVNLRPNLLGMVGFSLAEVERYVDEIFASYGFDESKKPTVLADLKSFYGGYSFAPNPADGPLYNSTICNWYLDQFVKDGGTVPIQVIDTNVRADIKWFRRLAQTNENAVARMREYFEQGRTESVLPADLMPRFRRIHPLSPEYLPVLLYYLGWLTFVDDNSLGCPNLYTQKLFVEVAGNRSYNWHTLQA